MRSGRSSWLYEDVGIGTVRDAQTSYRESTTRSDRWVLFADTWIRGHISRLGGKELALAADCARPRQLTEVRKSRPVGTRLALFAASR